MKTLERKNTESFAAYLYQMEGCPRGRDVVIWLEAERQLREVIFHRAEGQPMLGR